MWNANIRVCTFSFLTKIFWSLDNKTWHSIHLQIDFTKWAFLSMVWCSVRYECVFNFRKTFYVYIIKFQCTTNSNYIAQYFLFMLRILDWSKDIKNNVHMESIFLKALILLRSKHSPKWREKNCPYCHRCAFLWKRKRKRHFTMHRQNLTCCLTS